jgi:hypothetical protein
MFIKNQRSGAGFCLIQINKTIKTVISSSLSSTLGYLENHDYSIALKS